MDQGTSRPGVDQGTSRPGVDQETSRPGVDEQRSGRRAAGGGVVEDVAQLTGREFDGEQYPTDATAVSATDQTAAGPRARYQPFRLNGLHLRTTSHPPPAPSQSTMTNGKLAEVVSVQCV